MNRIVVSIAAVVLVALSCVAFAAPAGWVATTMYAAGSTGTLSITPDCVADGGGYIYSYTLANDTQRDSIVGFSLTFANETPVTGFTAITDPTGWSHSVWAGEENMIWWVAQGEGSALRPVSVGGTPIIVSFRSTLAPDTSKTAFASSQDSYGYSGQTFGPSPVPEPASVLALATGLMGLVGLKLRRK